MFLICNSLCVNSPDCKLHISTCIDCAECTDADIVQTLCHWPHNMTTGNCNKSTASLAVDKQLHTKQ